MEKLRELRKNIKRTQSQMAEFLGISQQAYATYENDKAQPPIDIIKKLANYFNVSVDYLIGRSEEDTVTPESEVVNMIARGGATWSSKLSQADHLKFIQYNKLSGVSFVQNGVVVKTVDLKPEQIKLAISIIDSIAEAEKE